MNRLKHWRLQRLSNPKAADSAPQDPIEPLVTSPDMFWCQTLSITQEQEGAVSKYVREFAGAKRLRISYFMLGARGVGKTCITHQLYLNKFPIFIGRKPKDSSYFEFAVTIEGRGVFYEGDQVSPWVEWSPANHPGPPHTVDTYFYMRHCETCLFVYDVSDRASFEAIKQYYQYFLLERTFERPVCDLKCSPSCIPRPPFRGMIFVIANKIDYEKKDWQVTEQEGQDFSTSIGGTFIPMSARTAEGANPDLLANMTKLILLRRLHYLSSID